jgi:hypothetical protein
MCVYIYIFFFSFSVVIIEVLTKFQREPARVRALVDDYLARRVT